MSERTLPPPDEGGNTDDPITAAIRAAVRAELAPIRALVERPHRRLYRPDEVADAIGCSTRKVYSLLAAGMPCVHVGTQRRCDLDDVIPWLREHGGDL